MLLIVFLADEFGGKIADAAEDNNVGEAIIHLYSGKRFLISIRELVPGLKIDPKTDKVVR